VKDGEDWIVFQWGPVDHIRLVRPDGTDEHQLLPNVDGLEVHPDWSPSGDAIAFGHTMPDGVEELWVSGADGSDARIIATADPGCAVRYPDWAEPDALLFQVECAGPVPGVEVTVVRSEIRRVDVATGLVTSVLAAEYPRTVEQPRLSPDGTRLAFVRFRLDQEVPDSALFVVDLESGNEAQLTDWPLMAFHPDWIDDDNLVLNRHWDPAADATDVPHDLYRVRADGTGLRNLTSYDASGPRAAHPRVLPDGKGITFTHVDGPGWGERIMAFVDLEGEGFRWLTPAATAGTHAQVRPARP
jgi:Tol biopolymer transport system component